MIAELRERIARLERMTRRLRPSRAPGILTSFTSRGVVRRPTSTKTITITTNNQIPRFL